MDLSAIGTCFEVTEDVIEEALRPAADLLEESPRERVFALLVHMAAIARPRQGSVKILDVLAGVSRCDWLEGSLEVRMAGDAERTTVELLVDDGLCTVKLRDTLRLEVPIAEFKKVLAARPGGWSPLALDEAVGDEVRLRAGSGGDEDPRSAVAPDLFENQTTRAVTPTPPPPPIAPPDARKSVPDGAALGKVVLEKRLVPSTTVRGAAPRPKSE
ncbi:MAG: hypothetical protein IT374_25950 [Polyangiaceae bacterium]|nr:hypothetical protein [Polyangiaceae bacterium]